jgi:hypothetical protein
MWRSSASGVCEMRPEACASALATTATKRSSNAAVIELLAQPNVGNKTEAAAADAGLKPGLPMSVRAVGRVMETSAAGLEAEFGAIRAELTLSWGNGQTEGREVAMLSNFGPPLVLKPTVESAVARHLRARSGARVRRGGSGGAQRANGEGQLLANAEADGHRDGLDGVRAIAGTEQKLSTEVPNEVRKRMPFVLLGLDTDNDSVFTICRNRIGPACWLKRWVSCWKIGDDGARAKALAAPAPHLSTTMQEEALCSFISSAGQLRRHVLRARLPNFFPAITKIEGVSDLHESRRAISEAGRWFP